MIPVNSTVIDFAFALHSKFLQTMKGATVNGKNVPLYTRLKANDEVRIITDDTAKNSVPLQWIVYCETKGARRAIYKIIKRETEEREAKLKALENN